MSETIVPIPAVAVPPGTPAWNLADASRWGRVRAASWARPLWSMAALLAAVVWAIAAEPDTACSDAASCGPDWPGMVEISLVLGLLYWLARLPELVLLAAPALAVIVAWTELPGAGRMSATANLAVLASLCLGCASAGTRLAVRRRQRHLAAAAAGVRHRLPEPAGPLRRGAVPITIGLLLCAGAGIALSQGIGGVGADERHAARAVRTPATVTARDEDAVRVRTADGRPLTVGAASPEDYRIGDPVTVLEDGPWHRLNAEPYDASGPQVLIMAAGLPGLSLLTAGLGRRRRAAALRRSPVPALRVLHRADAAMRTWVYAADDTSVRHPLFTCLLVPCLPEADAHDSLENEGDDEDTYEVADPGVREAVLFGAPYEGAELVLLTTDADTRPVLCRTASPVRRPGPGKGPQLDTGVPQTAPGAASAAYRTRADEIAAAMTPTGSPLRWGPGLRSRAAALVLIACLLFGSGVLTRSVVTDWPTWHIMPLLGLFFGGVQAAQALNWRVTADCTGLWLTGAFRVRHIPWAQLHSARHTDEGRAEIRLTDGTEWNVSGMAKQRLERRLSHRPSYVRMVEEVAALHIHPALRPAEAASRATCGRPLGPAVLLLMALVAGAVLVW